MPYRRFTLVLSLSLLSSFAFAQDDGAGTGNPLTALGGFFKSVTTSINNAATQHSPDASQRTSTDTTGPDGDTNATANDLLAKLRSTLEDKPSAVRPSLLPGLYGVYFNRTIPSAYVDSNFRFIGNSHTGYTYLSGPKRGQPLTAEESKILMRDFVDHLPRDEMMHYQFGKGTKQVFLVTAYDCPSCRALENELTKRAKSLDATVYIVPTSLNYSNDPNAKRLIQGVLCSEDRETAWHNLVTRHHLPDDASGCVQNPDEYADLWTIFPVKFPSSVPTVLTADGRIYATVMPHFDEIFRGR